MAQNTKQIIIIIVILIVAYIGYKVYNPTINSGTETLSAQSSGVSPEFVDGRNILTLLGELNRITLDSSIFSDKTFTSLVSFERPIADQVPGRPNPLLPIGTDNDSFVAPKATTTPASAISSPAKPKTKAR